VSDAWTIADVLEGRSSWAVVTGDCLRVLPTIPSGNVGACITDPPYGVEFRGHEWDKDIPEVAIRLPSMFPRVAIIMGTEAAWQFPRPKWVACWARPASNSRSKVGGFSHWSPVLLYGDITMSVDFRSWHAIANAYPFDIGHPSPKPECLMRWLVEELSEPGDTIIDPFCGSGTTGVACMQTGRKFIGIEIDENYAAIARRRIAEAANTLWTPAAPKHEQREMFKEPA